MIEKVNHPAHYGGGENPYEAIKVIEAWGLGSCLGNAVKYIARAGRKGDALTDLRKAAWYLQREIERINTAVAKGAPEGPAAAGLTPSMGETMSDRKTPGQDIASRYADALSADAVRDMAADIDTYLLPPATDGAAEGKYGIITASKKTFHPGEPVFLLRATDPLAPAAILEYSDICRRNGCAEEHVQAARAHWRRMLDWQIDNPSLVKRIPD